MNFIFIEEEQDPEIEKRHSFKKFENTRLEGSLVQGAPFID